MIREIEALKLAVYLFHLPSSVRAARDKPLPAGVLDMLQVAAGEEGSAEAAASRLERPVDVVRQACGFFIEQVMLAPDADAYRVLGASRATSDGDLRRHMALLLRWVHPDTDRAGDRSIYTGRVTTAWEALKTQDRRAAYDAAHPPKAATKAPKPRAARPPQRPQVPGPNGQARQKPPDEPAPKKQGLLGAAFRYILGRRDPTGR